MEQFAVVVNVAAYPSPFKHRAIFAAFDTLAPGLRMMIVNDHDPRPLHYQFQAERDGEFGWTYLEEGPETWRVAIERVSE